MKIIYIAFILLLPLRVSAEDCDALINTCDANSQAQCGPCGCIWNEGMGDGSSGTCEQCQAGYYRNSAYQNTCTSCSAYPYQEDSHKIFDTSYNNTLGLSYCPWVCATGYYRSSYNENTGEGECKQCGDGWTGCETAGATSATVGCPSGSYKTIGTDGVVTCTQCGEYAFVRDNRCVCKGNTYSDGTTCTKCPAGMLTVVDTPEPDAIHNPNFQGDPGATDKTQCKIGAFTKFCDGNGTHCMRLMQ